MGPKPKPLSSLPVIPSVDVVALDALKIRLRSASVSVNRDALFVAGGLLNTEAELGALTRAAGFAPTTLLPEAIRRGCAESMRTPPRPSINAQFRFGHKPWTALDL